MSFTSRLDLAIFWKADLGKKTFTYAYHKIKQHTHSILTAVFPGEPGYRLLLNSHFSFIPKLCILLGQASTFHVILITIPPGLLRTSCLSNFFYFLCHWPSHYHLYIQQVQTVSTYSSWSSNWLFPILRVLWVFAFLTFNRLNSTHPSNHTHFSVIQLQFKL